MTAGYRIYEGYNKIFGDMGPVSLFMMMAAVLAAADLLSGTAFAATGGGLGMDMQGNIEATDFTQASTKEFAQNLGLSFTAVRVVGTVIIAAGLVATAIRYRSEDQAQRAQELLIRGGLALLIVNILPTIIRFVAGAFYTGM